MLSNRQNTSHPSPPEPTALLSPTDIIDTMIDLRIQLYELERRIRAFQPAFSAACTSLNTPKIQIERAIITRKLTPRQWTYSSDILEQEVLLKQLKHLFQQDHEPSGGRELAWIVKLLLVKAQSTSESTTI